MWRLLYPLRYFSLINSEKRSIEGISTIVIALVISMPFIVLPGAIFFHPNGFLDRILILTSALTGFYVAALVAAATFQHPDLDKTISAGSIALLTKGSDGRRISEYLTRREFACMIFGYLAFSALTISIISCAGVGLSTVDLKAMETWWYVGVLFSREHFEVLRGVVIIVIALLVAHLVSTTLLGLYYLMDRLYRRDRQITSRKTDTEAAA